MGKLKKKKKEKKERKLQEICGERERERERERGVCVGGLNEIRHICTGE